MEIINKAKIYKLYSMNSNKVYYGSTCNSLSLRKAIHKHEGKLYEEGKKKSKCTSYDIFCDGDVKIELLEEIQYNDKKDIYDRERFYIDNNECVNKNIPNRTRDETLERMRINQRNHYANQEFKDKKKQYYQDNKESILRKQRDRYLEHKKII